MADNPSTPNQTPAATSRPVTPEAARQAAPNTSGNTGTRPDSTTAAPINPNQTTASVSEANSAPTNAREPVADVNQAREDVPVANVNQGREEEPVANVNEQQPAAEVNEGVNFDTLSISEQSDYLSILQEKDKRGILSVDEKQILNNQKEKDNKTNENPGYVGPKDGDDENDPDPEKNGPFKEEDIIKYMYNEWLLGGANWLWTKTAAKLDKGYFKAMRAINRRRRERQIERGKTYETESNYNKIADKAEASGNSATEGIEKHREKQLKNLKLLKEGKIDEAGVSDTTKVLLKNMDPKEREQFLKISEQGINNFYDNMIMAKQFASNYAQAGMALDLAQNKDAYAGKNLEEEFAKQEQTALKLFGRLLDQEAARGGDPAKLAANLFNTSQKAVSAAEKTMDKRQFAEKGNKPNTDLAKNVVAISDKLKSVDKEDQQRGMFEAALADQQFDRSSSQNMETVNRAAAANLIRKDENNGRRDRVDLLKQKLGLTKENTDAFTKNYQQLRGKVEKAEYNQRMADTLSGPAALGRFGAGGR